MDDSERKRSAVSYPPIAVECLWKSALSFANLAHSYEDFKAEVTHMYLEAWLVQQYTISGLQQLVLDQAHTPIRSEQELSWYH